MVTLWHAPSVWMSALATSRARQQSGSVPPCHRLWMCGTRRRRPKSNTTWLRAFDQDAERGRVDKGCTMAAPCVALDRTLFVVPHALYKRPSRTTARTYQPRSVWYVSRLLRPFGIIAGANLQPSWA